MLNRQRTRTMTRRFLHKRPSTVVRKLRVMHTHLRARVKSAKDTNGNTVVIATINPFAIPQTFAGA